MKHFTLCSHCGKKILSTVFIVEGQCFCENCYGDMTFRCECYGEHFLNIHDSGNESIALCQYCYDNYYHRCARCNTLVYNDDVCWDNDDPYCSECYGEYHEGCIKDYYYKPSPIFHKRKDEESPRYYGVELEIDRGGKDYSNAELIFQKANQHDDVLYIKSDGSLDEGMELVSHHCSVLYHKYELPWKEVMKEAIRLGYRSHNTTTCGYHIHIGHSDLGDTVETQEEVIGRIMFFFESHWNEIFAFSRRGEYAVNQWASRYGYKDKPKDILENAKKHSRGRYTCVNITNFTTVEIRIFRGTLKWNTFMAALELVDSICENAIRLSDEEIHKQSWNDFVLSIDPDYTELVKYLKEKRLYVNDPVEYEEEV